MTRRRLILAACVAVVALAAVWWLSSDRLTAEEWQIVGAWRYNDAATGNAVFRIIFTADRRSYDPDFPNRAPCLWYIEGGSIVFDHEPSSTRRMLRPVAGLLRLNVGPWYRYPFEVTGDTLTVRSEPNPPSVWTRDRGD
jgi:hypothetical protein